MKPAVLDVTDLVIGYGGIPLASGISLKVPAGSSLLVIGHNGSGKSTLLRSLFGLQQIISGTGTVGGCDVWCASPQLLYRLGFRFLGQGPRAFNELSVRESRGVLRRIYGFEAAIGADADSALLPFPADKRIGQLSIGQRRSEALSLLSVGWPVTFFLDEPTAGLDTRRCSEISSWIIRRREAGIAFVVVEQRFRDLLPIFDLAAVMRRGKLTFFGRAEALSDEKRLAEVFL
jgi:branched-chain amino acid transport system ATP-binding protein